MGVGKRICEVRKEGIMPQTTDERRIDELVAMCRKWEQFHDKLLMRLSSVTAQLDAVILALREAKYCDNYTTRDEQHIWHDGMCLVCETPQASEE